MEKELREIFNAYGFNEEQYVGKKAISVGHINTSYKLYFDYGDRVKRYIIQEINTNVFKNPDELMDNITRVSNYSKNLLSSFGVPNYKSKVLRIFKTVDGNTYIKTTKGKYFRVYHFIEGGINFNTSDDPKVFEAGGRAIGYFQNMLANFPIQTLHETIKDFHNTPKRYLDFEKAKENAPSKLVSNVKEQIDFIEQNNYIKDYIQPLLDSGKMPLKVTHNDTKLNNIMFSTDKSEGLALIDLDTVMPGSICYDFGDFVRSACNNGEEDSKDLTLVSFNEELFKSFAKGYLKTIKASISKIEVDNLVNGCILMTYEVGMRFLTDYLNGNIYFKVEYPEHNLVRAKTQIKMVQEMLARKEHLEELIQELYQSL